MAEIEINNVKLANSVKIGSDEMPFFDVFKVKPRRYKITLDGLVVKIEDIISKEKHVTFTSLMNVISWRAMPPQEKADDSKAKDKPSSGKGNGKAAGADKGNGTPELNKG